MNNTLIGPVGLFKSSWAFYKSHWKALVEIVAIPYVAIYLGSLLGALSLSRGHAETAASAGLGILGLVITIAAAIFFAASISGLVSAIDKLSKGHGHVSLGAQYKIGFSLFWPFVLIALIRGVASVGSFVLLFIPGIVFAVYSSLIIYSLVVDGKHGMSAFADSFSLIRGHWWGVLGRSLFLALCYFIAAVVKQGIVLVVRGIAGYAALSSPDLVINGILSALLVLAYMPFAMVYLYRLFEALKHGRQSHVSEKTFIRWVVAFMVIGVLVAAGIAASIPFRKAVLEARSGMPQQLQITITKTPAGDSTVKIQSDGSLVH